MNKGSLITAIFIALFFVFGCTNNCQEISAKGIDGLIVLGESGSNFEREKLANIDIYYSLKEGRVNSIVISSKEFCTVEGIRVGSIIKQYKKELQEISGIGEIKKSNTKISSFERHLTQEGVYIISTGGVVTSLFISE